MAGKIFIESAFLKKALWFLARASVFMAVWWCFIRISGWFYFHYLHDVGSTYWSIGLMMATPLVVLVWFITDVVFWRKGKTIGALWRVTGISLIIHLILSPLWCITVWLIDKHITHFIRIFYFILF